jgi:uncharacterized protein with PQ loop repeat
MNNILMESQKYQGIAIISGVLTILAFGHLVYRVYLTNQTEHLTYLWVLLVLTSQSLLVLYGLLNNLYGIYLPAIILMIGISYILYVKINNSVDTNVETQLKNKNII